MQRTIYIKKLVNKKKLDDPCPNMYDIIYDISNHYKEATCIRMDDKQHGEVGIIVSIIPTQDNFILLHLMWCDASNIAIWDDNKNTISSKKMPKGTDVIKGETFILAINNKDYFLNCFKDFYDYFAISALFHVYKTINTANKVNDYPDEDYSSLSIYHMANMRALDKIQEEGIKQIDYNYLIYRNKLQECNLPSELKDCLLYSNNTDTQHKTKDKNMAQVKVSVKGKYMHLSEELVSNMVKQSTDDDERSQFVITTNKGTKIEHGNIIFKNTVTVKKRENTDFMDSEDIKNKILEYYSNFNSNSNK